VIWQNRHCGAGSFRDSLATSLRSSTQQRRLYFLRFLTRRTLQAKPLPGRPAKYRLNVIFQTPSGEKAYQSPTSLAQPATSISYFNKYLHPSSQTVAHPIAGTHRYTWAENDSKQKSSATNPCRVELTFFKEWISQSSDCTKKVERKMTMAGDATREKESAKILQRASEGQERHRASRS
jgi:hypothetical protein